MSTIALGNTVNATVCSIGIKAPHYWPFREWNPLAIVRFPTWRAESVSMSWWYHNVQYFPTILFHNNLSLSGEQPEQRILAHKSEQPTAARTVIFHKYCCYIKHRGTTTNLNLQNPWGMLPICQNAAVRVYGAWLKINYCSDLFWSVLVRHGAPAFVKLAFCNSFYRLQRNISTPLPPTQLSIYCYTILICIIHRVHIVLRIVTNCYRSVLPITSTASRLALRQSHDCPGAKYAIQKYMYK